jgi:hypothetical protein
MVGVTGSIPVAPTIASKAMDDANSPCDRVELLPAAKSCYHRELVRFFVTSTGLTNALAALAF